MKKVIVGLVAVAVVLSLSACMSAGSGSVKSGTAPSRALQKVDYNADAGTLVLVFEQGLYEFAGVPQDIYLGLMSSGSMNSYFEENIKGKYKARKVE